MSTTIDQRVAELRFDNSHFEKNVATSMSTLDKLKQKLNLTGASKGLQDVGTAAKKIDLSHVGNSAETVGLKFNAMYTMADQALRNITNRVQQTAEHMVKAFTIDPIKTGFSEYETQINAIQTILANTESKGTTLDDVNGALDELNKYADKTIYNFTEMTRNIGTFTAAGVDLDTSVNAIQGIANLAAVSGSSSQQASTAMYQLSQALASGTVKLMDWNSVVNAGMGGEVFQNALKETARVHGIAIDDMIASQGSFRETLSEGWLTSEILTETLQKFTLTTEGLTEEQIKANREMLKAKGYTDDQIDEIFKLGETATNAATKVKTFTQLWDVLKEAAQSGWTQTWELLIGDFEQAKALLTPLSDFFTGIINKTSEWRNAVLKGALTLATPFTKVIEKINSVTGATEEVINATKNYGDIVNKVIAGDYGNGQSRWDKLTEEGYDWAKVQNMVNEKLGDSTRHTEKLTEAQEKQNQTQGQTVEGLLKMTDAQLKEIGFTKEEIQALRELEVQAKKAGYSVAEVVDNPDLLSGRTLLINAFKNMGQSILGVCKAIKEAWQSVFLPKSVEERSAQLYNMIAAIHKFSQSLILTDEKTGKLNETGQKIQRTFRGMFAALDLILTVIGGPIKIAFKILTQLLGAFDLNILDVTAAVGDVIYKFNEWLESTLDFTAVFKKIVPYVNKATKSAKEFFKSMKESEAIKKLVSYLKDSGKAIKDWIKGLKDADNIPRDIIEGLVNGLRDGGKKAWDAIIELGKGLLQKIKEVLGIHSPSTEFFEIGKNIIDGLVNGLQNGFSKVVDFCKNLGTNIVDFFNNIPWGNLFAGGATVGMLVILNKLAGAFATLASPLEGLGDLMSGAGEVMQKSAKGVNKVLKSTAKVVKSFANVMNGVAFSIKARALKNIAVALAILVGSVIALSFIDTGKLWASIGAVAVLSAILVGLAFAADKLSQATVTIDKNGLQKSGFASGLLAIGATLLLLAATIKMIGSMNPEQAKQGFLGLAGLVVAVGVVFAAYGQLVKGKSAQNIDKAGSMMLKLSGALLLMVWVAKLIAGMSWGDMAKAGVGILGFVGIVALLAVIGMIPSKNIKNIGPMMTKIAGAFLLMTIVAKLIAGMSWADMGKAAVGMLGLVGIIAILTLITKLAGGKLLGDIGDTLLKISGAMLILTGVGKMLAGMSWGDMAKAAVGLAGLAGVIAILVAIVKSVGKDAPKIAGTLLAMSLAVGILAIVAVALSLISIEGLAKGIIAVGLLSAFMAGMIYATKGATDMKGSLIAMAAAIGILALALVALSFIDPKKLIGPTLAMGTLMGMFALIVKAGGTVQSAMGSLIVMTVAIGVLGTILILLARLPIEQTLGAAAGLSIVLLSMAAAMVIMGTVGSMATSGLIAMGVLTLVVAALGGILYLLKDLPIESTLGTAAALSTLLLAMSASLAILGVVGLMGPAAFIGIAALATLIVGIGGLVVAIGALMTKFPQLEEFLNKGLPVLGKIGTGIGQFFGSLISGFATEVMTILPALGASLGAFMVNLTPFIAGAKMVDASVLAGIGIIAASVIALTAADLIAGIGAFLSGGTSFAQLGMELSQFMINAIPFITMANMIKPEAMTGIKSLAEAILILTGANLIEGLTKLFGGESSLTTFGSQLGQLALDLKTFVTNLGTFSEDQVTTVNCAGQAIKALASAASSIPNEGGWAAKILGDNSLATFGSKLPQLGLDLKGFITNLGTFSEEQVTTIKCAGQAISALAEAASNIPNEGGWAAKILGDNSLATFGSKLPKLGTDIKGFVTNLGTFGEDNIATVKCAGNAIKALADAAGKIPNEGGLWAKICGDNSLATFGSKLPGLATNLKGFITNLGSFGEEKIAVVNAAVKAIKAIAKLGEIDIDATSSGLGDLGKKLEGFAKKLASFVEKMSEVGSENITNAVTKTKELIELAKSAASTNVESLSTFGNSLKKVAKEGVKGFVKEFDGEAPKSKVTKAAKAMMNALIKGLEDKKESVGKKAKNIASSAAGKMKSEDITAKAKSAGKALVNGFADGISDQTFKAEAKAKAMAQAAVAAAKEALDINSPSKVFRAIGYSVPEGFAMGIDKLGGMAIDSVSTMAGGAISSVKSAISRVSELVNTDIDSQPTIRPVLDLSDVQSGAGLLSGMFDTTANVGVMSNVRSISSMMNNRQNGNNDDVVSALKDLRQSLGNTGGTTYNINGVSYDGSSGVVEAIETITRAARIERRI